MISRISDSGDQSLFDVHTAAPGPKGSLPITADMLLRRPSGDLFGLSQNAGMGWDPALLDGPEVLLLSTHGGIRAADVVALGPQQPGDGSHAGARDADEVHLHAARTVPSPGYSRQASRSRNGYAGRGHGRATTTRAPPAFPG